MLIVDDCWLDPHNLFKYCQCGVTRKGWSHQFLIVNMLPRGPLSVTIRSNRVFSLFPKVGAGIGCSQLNNIDCTTVLKPDDRNVFWTRENKNRNHRRSPFRSAPLWRVWMNSVRTLTTKYKLYSLNFRLQHFFNLNGWPFFLVSSFGYHIQRGYGWMNRGRGILFSSMT